MPFTSYLSSKHFTPTLKGVLTDSKTVREKIRLWVGVLNKSHWNRQALYGILGTTETSIIMLL